MGDSKKIKLELLRNRCIALVAFTAICRPSDIYGLSTKDIIFNDNDESVQINFIGNKTDKQKEGNIKTVFSNKNQKEICPIDNLKQYIERTKSIRGDLNYLWITLSHSTQRLSLNSINKIMKKIAVEASNQNATAGSFRPSGVNAAIEEGFHPSVPFKLGQWKNWDVFINHYANQTKIPTDYSVRVLRNTSISLPKPISPIKEVRKSQIKSPTRIKAISPLLHGKEDSSIPKNIKFMSRSPTKRQIKVTSHFGDRVFS